MDTDLATDMDTAADGAPASLARALASPARERALASLARDRTANTAADPATDTTADPAMDTTATATRARTASTATSMESGHKDRAAYVGERSSNLMYLLRVFFVIFREVLKSKTNEEIKKKRREGDPLRFRAHS
jgi:hypothetical protein